MDGSYRQQRGRWPVWPLILPWLCRLSCPGRFDAGRWWPCIGTKFISNQRRIGRIGFFCLFFFFNFYLKGETLSSTMLDPSSPSMPKWSLACFCDGFKRMLQMYRDSFKDFWGILSDSIWVWNHSEDFWGFFQDLWGFLRILFEFEISRRDFWWFFKIFIDF